MTTKQYEIVDGPSIEGTVASYRYAYSKDVTVKTEFTMISAKGNQVKVEAKVVGMSYESGTEGMFILELHCSSFTREDGTVTGTPGVFHAASAFYDARNRKGSLKPKE